MLRINVFQHGKFNLFSGDTLTGAYDGNWRSLDIFVNLLRRPPSWPAPCWRVVVAEFAGGQLAQARALLAERAARARVEGETGRAVAVAAHWQEHLVEGLVRRARSGLCVLCIVLHLRGSKLKLWQRTPGKPRPFSPLENEQPAFFDVLMTKSSRYSRGHTRRHTWSAHFYRRSRIDYCNTLLRQSLSTWPKGRPGQFYICKNFTRWWK